MLSLTRQSRAVRACRLGCAFRDDCWCCRRDALDPAVTSLNQRVFTRRFRMFTTASTGSPPKPKRSATNEEQRSSEQIRLVVAAMRRPPWPRDTGRRTVGAVVWAACLRLITLQKTNPSRVSLRAGSLGRVSRAPGGASLPHQVTDTDSNGNLIDCPI